MMPCCRIESISSCNASRPKSFRGCNVLGTTLARLIWCTLSPGSATSVLATMEGVPISAPSPLPRPERAMPLRLPEQLYQGKQQSAQSISTLKRAAALPPEKEFKKSIDTKTRNSVSTWMVPKQTKDFYPVGSLSVRESQ